MVPYFYCTHYNNLIARYKYRFKKELIMTIVPTSSYTNLDNCGINTLIKQHILWLKSSTYTPDALGISISQPPDTQFFIWFYYK